MKAFVRALTVMAVGTFIGLFSACGEDNDKRANITSDPNPPSSGEVNRPAGPKQNKDLADKQRRQLMSNPDYPQPNQTKTQ
jgi:hypothetical protein